MQPAKLVDLHVLCDGPRKLHREVGFKAQHVRRLHGAGDVHQHARERPLKLDQARGYPKCAKALGNRQPHLASDRNLGAVARTDQIDRGLLHAPRAGNHLLAFVCRAHAVDVTGEQGNPELPLEVVNLASQGIHGLTVSFRR